MSSKIKNMTCCYMGQCPSIVAKYFSFQYTWETILLRSVNYLLRQTTRHRIWGERLWCCPCNKRVFFLPGGENAVMITGLTKGLSFHAHSLYKHSYTLGLQKKQTQSCPWLMETQAHKISGAWWELPSMAANRLRWKQKASRVKEQAQGQVRGKMSQGATDDAKCCRWKTVWRLEVL